MSSEREGCLAVLIVAVMTLGFAGWLWWTYQTWRVCSTVLPWWACLKFVLPF